MSTSTSKVYVWVWLPGQTEPVPAGVLTGTADSLSFRYGDRYREREDAVSLSPTLPLGRGASFGPTADMPLPSAIRDAAPDAWGRRVILSQLTNSRGAGADTSDLSELTYLLHSNSDRIGAIDFQQSADSYVPRGTRAEISELQVASDLLAEGKEIPDSLRAAANSGTGIGGARPKALLTVSGVPSLAKFSVSTDVFPAVEAEALASNLARRAGLRTAATHWSYVNGRYALLSERFDRIPDGGRVMMLSALTLTGRGEIDSRYSSYGEIVAKVRAVSSEPDLVGPEMFDRVALNMMISNSDDHLRNHAVLWDGYSARLTPAYDLAPSARREGAELTLTLPYNSRGDRLMNLALLQKDPSVFGVSQAEARERIEHLWGVIDRELDDAADEMGIAGGVLNVIRHSFLHGTVTRDFP